MTVACALRVDYDAPRRYKQLRDLLGVLLDKDQRYTFSEVDALIDNFMKGKVN